MRSTMCPFADRVVCALVAASTRTASASSMPCAPDARAVEDDAGASAPAAMIAKCPATRRRARQDQAMQALLDAATEMQTRCDFLSGIAALVEAHRFEPFQIERLRDELIRVAGIDPRQACGDIGKAPRGERCGYRASHRCGTQPGDALLRTRLRECVAASPLDDAARRRSIGCAVKAAERPTSGTSRFAPSRAARSARAHRASPRAPPSGNQSSRRSSATRNSANTPIARVPAR